MKQLLLVGFGGFFGSIARYWMSKLNLTWDFHSIPMGTLAVNIIGSFLIGFMLGIFMNSNLLHTNLKLFLVVGFCGGFTTFSTFSLENLTLWNQGAYGIMFSYILLSVLLGFFAVVVGHQMVKV